MEADRSRLRSWHLADVGEGENMISRPPRGTWVNFDTRIPCQHLVISDADLVKFYRDYAYGLMKIFQQSTDVKERLYCARTAKALIDQMVRLKAWIDG